MKTVQSNMVTGSVSADVLLERLRAEPDSYIVTDSNKDAVAELEARGLIRTETTKVPFGRKRGLNEFVKEVTKIILKATIEDELEAPITPVPDSIPRGDHDENDQDYLGRPK